MLPLHAVAAGALHDALRRRADALSLLAPAQQLAWACVVRARPSRRRPFRSPYDAQGAALFCLLVTPLLELAQRQRRGGAGFTVRGQGCRRLAARL